MKIVLMSLVLLVSYSMSAQTIQDLQRSAQKEGKYIFLSFTAAWCGPCKWMDKNVFADSSIQEILSKHYIFSKVDIDFNSQIASYFSIRSIPEYLILDSTLTILENRGGTMSRSQLAKMLLKPLKSPTQERLGTDKSSLPAAPNVPISASSSSSSPLNLSWVEQRFYSKWKAGLTLGVSCSWFDVNMVTSEVHPRFQGGIFIFYESSPRFFIQPGIFYSRKGGTIESGKKAISYLEMPLVLSRQLLQYPSLMGCREGLYLDVAPYTAFRLGSSSIFSRTDFGVKLGLSTTLGSFVLATGYAHGFQNIRPNGSEVFNRCVYLQTSLVLGR